MLPLSGNSELKSSRCTASEFNFSALLGVIVLMLLLLVAGEASAATYYLSPSGNDSSIGAANAPWATFGKAMTVLKPGDILYLEDGVYNQSLNVKVSGTSNAFITIKALNEGNAIVSTTYPVSPILIVNHAYIEVDGINFRNSGPACPSDDYSDACGLNDTDGLHIYNDDHIILRRITSNGSSGYNSSVISLSGVTNSLLEDCAASGQGRVILNLLGCNNITVRRCWLNWSGPPTGGGDVSSLSQIYDSNDVLLENNIGLNYTTSATDFFSTWGHYGSISGNTFIGNISYIPIATDVGGFRDDAECGYATSGTVFSNNVSITGTNGGNAADSVNASPGNGTVFNNNTFAGKSDNTGNGIYLGNINNCPAQSGSIKNVYNNSFVNFSSAIAANSLGSNYVQAHDYNNFYNIASLFYNAKFMTPQVLSSHENLNTLNPSYDTADYGLGAYLIVPSSLKGRGQDGSDIGAEALYSYEYGILTNIPLWPWPMEMRIVNEFSISPTWEVNGGLWTTLNGVYTENVYTTPPQPPQIANRFAFAVWTGGRQHMDPSGDVYLADTDYSGGKTGSTTAAIAGATDPILYQFERYGNFSYNIPLNNGNYTVTLKFAEIYWNGAGQRIFNVSMQGTPVISNLDIYAQVGKDAAYDVTIPVSVTNGMLNIAFTSVVDNAKVSAIEISLSSTPPSSASLLQGLLDAGTCSTIAGWAWDADSPSATVSVDIYDGSTFLTTVSAGNFRADLAAAGIGNGNHGFSYTQSFNDGKTHTIYAYFSGTRTSLGASPKTTSICGVASTPSFGGFIDVATCSTIAGWAWDANSPSATVSVDIYDGSTFLTTVSAGNFRADLVAAGIGNGNHGFSYTPSFNDGNAHTIYAYFSGTSTSLGASPKTTSTCSGL